MGKNNNNQRPQRRPNPKNPDPMSNSRSMAREGIRIIRNIAFGKCNVASEGYLFQNESFVKATIGEVDKRIMDLKIHINAINYAYRGTTSEEVNSLLFRDMKALNGWNLVRNQLYNILYSNGDLGFLYTIANKLPEYKYYI